MSRFAFLFAAVVVVASGIACAALACSCMRYGTAGEQLDQADAVFRARVVASRRLDAYEALTTFEVIESLKGPTGRVEIRHETQVGGMCGIVFQPGEELALTAFKAADGSWRTNSCAIPQHPWTSFREAAGR